MANKLNDLKNKVLDNKIFIKKPQGIIQNCNENPAKNFLPKEFSILSWNIQKSNQKENYKQYIKSLHKEKNINIICLQEAEYISYSSFSLNGFCYNFLANLELKNKTFGVMTASSSFIYNSKGIISKYNESFIKTHKASILTDFYLENGKKITVLNVHAINFKSSNVYSKEMTLYFNILESIKNPIIVLGDFNTWNSKRMEILNSFCKALNFKKVEFTEITAIKHFNKYPLDFILYKNLELTSSKAIYTNNISDHNPLFAKFKL